MTEVIEKMPLTSLDIKEDQLNKLRAIFPEVFNEDKVDWEKLQLTLGEAIDSSDERFGMSWPGKSECFKVIQQPSVGTLKPCKEESINWDSTENLFIEGDNLEVLKLLQQAYYSKVKMIYIDPPYNTGKEFIYPDNYTENLQTYLAFSGQLDEKGFKFSTNLETDGRYHSKWMNMMYPRLFLARNLLRDDGVIFISIDDNEVDNLKKICNEIFGDENFIAQLAWEKKKKGSFLSKKITNIKEYILTYSKNKEYTTSLIAEINSSEETYPCINASNKREIRKIPAGISSKFKEKDYYLKAGSEISVETMTLLLHSDLIIENGVLKSELLIEGNWRYNQESIEQYAKEKNLYITQDLYIRRIVAEPRNKLLKDWLPRVSDYQNNVDIDLNNLNNSGWGSNEDAEEELRTIFCQQNLMTYPKPVKLLLKLTACIRESDFLILDFFAGSATLADAVMQLNRKDGGNRKYIMVQLPEPCDENSEAYKAGYKTIADIGKARIKKVIEKFSAPTEQLSLTDNTANQDLGFQVYKLAESNFKLWSNTTTETEDLEKQLKAHIDYIKTGASDEDVLYEVLLKAGYPLATKIETLTLADKTVYSIDSDTLLICLDRQLSKEVITAMAQREPQRVVCLDTGFINNDQLKTNAVQIMKSHDVKDFQTV